MPYIIQDQREFLEERLKEICELVEDLPLGSGDIVYIITKILLSHLKKKEICFENLSDIIKILECAKMEYYRRVMVPYEESKIKERGDVY